MKYLIVIEPTATGFSAFSPDRPGCVSTGRSRDEVERDVQEAIAFHIEGLRAQGDAVPTPSTSSSYVAVGGSQP